MRRRARGEGERGGKRERKGEEKMIRGVYKYMCGGRSTLYMYIAH